MGKKEWGTLRERRSWKVEAQGLVGDWGKLWGMPEKEGHRQMPPREPKREREAREWETAELQ